MIDFKPNFFSSAKPASESLLQIAFCNDPKFRASYGQWLYENFDDLAREYKTYGRFLTLAEIEENPLQ